MERWSPATLFRHNGRAAGMVTAERAPLRAGPARSPCSDNRAAAILTAAIFQGLAISLLFGFASSALLTLLVIPAICRVLRT